MTRAQAIALSAALATQDIGHSIGFTYDAGGNETASVSLATGPTYTGAQLAQLTNYCAQHGLNLTIVVDQMGVT